MTLKIAELANIRRLAATSSRLTVVTGRCRVGKTELLERAYNDGQQSYLYLLISQRAEKDLCAYLQDIIQRVCRHPILGHAERFGELFRVIMESAREQPLTVVIDEFQEFDKINPAIFTDIQGVWDELHKKTRLNLIVCGSVNRLMNKIFFDDRQPLYGRNTGKIHLDPFPVNLLKTILNDYAPRHTSDDLLTLWTLTGGVARYVELLIDARAFTRRKMLETVFSLSSSYIDEGKVALEQEFGKDSGVYFSILASIATGRTSYADIRNAVGAEVGGQLSKLENTYQLIVQKQPACEKATTRNCLYTIDDCFFRFWFRFVYRYQHLLEQKQYDEARSLVNRDFNAFSGISLERYFKTKFIEERRCTKIEGWWDRKGENEIDLVCENELTGVIDFYEVKHDPTRFDRQKLSLKIDAFFRKHPNFKNRPYGAFGISLDDM